MKLKGQLGHEAEASRPVVAPHNIVGTVKDATMMKGQAFTVKPKQDQVMLAWHTGSTKLSAQARK